MNPNDEAPTERFCGLTADQHAQVVQWGHDVFNNKLHPLGLARNVSEMLAPDGVALGEDGLCRSCGYADWCRKHGKCYRSMQPLSAGVPGTYNSEEKKHG